LIALLLGLLLVAAPFTKNSAVAEESYDEDDDDDGAAGEKDDDEKDVVVLTSSNFDKIIKKAPYALVEFYAPWCGHCKNLKPHYAKAATNLKAYNPDIVIAKVDATQESELGQKFGVQGYPTIKWFVNGEVASDYGGGRDADGITNWVKRKSGPFATKVDSADKLAELEKDAAVIIVGYFKALEGADYDAFKAVGQKVEDATFVETTEAAVGKAANLEKFGIAAIKNFKGEPREVVVLSGEIDADSVKDFVTAEKMPLTIEFTSENSDKIFNSGINKQLIVWSKAADFEADAAVYTALKSVAKKLKGKLVFVTVNNEGDSAEPVTNYFGLKDAESPQVLGFYMEKNKKFKFTGEVNAEALEAFAQSVIDGTAVADYKSAPIPEDNKDGEVTIVVGKSFDSIVKDAKKDVLLEVYAPWCGHCKKLDPIYKKLAKRFKKVESVVIAKMDGTENEHPDVEVKGFPTIVFFPAGEDKTPITFEGGDRSLKELTKFIKKHAKIPYELPKKGEDGEKSEEKGAEAKDEL